MTGFSFSKSNYLKVYSSVCHLSKSMKYYYNCLHFQIHQNIQKRKKEAWNCQVQSCANIALHVTNQWRQLLSICTYSQSLHDLYQILKSNKIIITVYVNNQRIFGEYSTPTFLVKGFPGETSGTKLLQWCFHCFED